jgi:hypothetical protein
MLKRCIIDSITRLCFLGHLLFTPNASTRSLAVTIATGLPSSVRGSLFILLDVIILAASFARMPIWSHN